MFCFVYNNVVHTNNVFHWMYGAFHLDMLLENIIVMVDMLLVTL